MQQWVSIFNRNLLTTQDSPFLGDFNAPTVLVFRIDRYRWRRTRSTSSLCQPKEGQLGQIKTRDPTSSDLPILNKDIQKRICAHINGKNGDILLRTWTKRQILQSCGELSKELTAEQNARHRTKQLPSMESRSIVPAASRQVQQWADTLLQAKPN